MIGKLYKHPSRNLSNTYVRFPREKKQDYLAENLDPNAGLVVSCTLDLVERPINSRDIGNALEFYREKITSISLLPIKSQRKAICDYIETGKIPACI